MPEAEPPTSSSLSSSKSKTANPSINQIPPRSKKHPVKASLFNEHDNDWPAVDLGNLITDLDADINQTQNSPKMSVNNNNSAGSPPSGGGGNAGNSSTLNSKPNVNNSSKIIPLVSSKITVPPPNSVSKMMSSTSSSTNIGGSATATITESRSIMDSGNNEKGLKMKIKRNKTSISHGSSVCNSNTSSSTSTITSSSEPNNANTTPVVVSSISSGNSGSNSSSNNPVVQPEIKTTSTTSPDASPSVNSHPPTHNNSSNMKANNNMDGKAISTQPNAKLTPKPQCNSKPSSSVVPSPVTNNSKQQTALNGENSSSSASSSSIMPPSLSEGGGTLSQASNNCSSQKSFIKVDASVGTEIGTMTEPDCLGPLDPGTSVTLEGIVWHETEGGVLVINVTWRGKTYVGTLLDSTQHVNQWAPPRYSESPTAEIDNKKGRGNKRAGRPGSEPELTRKNLRSSKGKPLKGAAASANSPSKRKKGGSIKDEDSNDSTLSSTLKRQRTSSKNNSADENEDGVVDDSEKEINSKDNMDTPVPNNKETNSKDNAATEEEMTPKDPKEVKYIPPPPLPYALTCPSPGCKKRYRQHNGLRFHISHSHKELLDSKGDIRDTSDIERCEKEAKERLRKRGIILEGEKQQENDDSSCSTDSSKNSTPGLLSNAAEVNGGSSNKEEDLLLKNSESSSTELSPMETEPAGVSTTVSTSEGPLLNQGKPLSSVRPLVMSSNNQGNGGGDPSQTLSKDESSEPQIQSSDESNNKKDDEDTAAPTEGSVSSLMADKVGIAESSSSHNLIKSPAYSDISDDGGEDDGKKNADLKIKSKPSSTPILPPNEPVVSTPVQTSSSSSSSTTIQSPVVAPSNNHFPFAPYIPSTTTTASSITTTTSSSSFKPEVSTTSSSSASASSKPPIPGSAEYHQKMLQAYGFPQFPPYPPLPGGGIDPNLHLHLLNSDPSYKAKFEKDKATLKEQQQFEREQKEKDRRRSNVGITPPPSSSCKTPEDLRKPPIPSPRCSMISVKPEFNVPKSEPGQKTTPQTTSKDEGGAKPTMETRGPPPASINHPYGYLHPSLMRPPPVGLSYEALAAAAVSGSINPLLLSPNPYMPNPYLPPHMPPSMRPPYGGGGPDPLRGSYPQVPEDLSRSVSVGPPSGGSNSSVGPPHSSSSSNNNPSSSSTTKALDLLQQHASQYYSNNSHKIHELSSDRGMKSPSEKGANKEHSSVSSRKRTPSPANASLSGVNRSRSPPPLRHVHTHTHTHFGLGYPLLHPPPGGVPPPAAHTPFTPGAYPSHLLPPSGSKGSLPSGPLGQSFPPPPK